MNTATQENEHESLELGSYLKARREERHLSLEDVHLATRVPMTKLALIEQEAFAQLDHKVFVQGYIRSYAKFVGADADLLVDRYKALTRTEEPVVELAEEAAADQPDKIERYAPVLKLVNQLFMHRKLVFLSAAFCSVLTVLIVLTTRIASNDDAPVHPSRMAAEASASATLEDDASLGAPAESGMEPHMLAPGASVAEPSAVPEPSAIDELSAITEPLTIESPIATDSSANEQPSAALESPAQAQYPSSPDASIPKGNAEDITGFNTDAVSDSLKRDAANTHRSAASQAPILGASPLESEAASAQDNTHSALAMSFTDECWVEVRDANDDVVFAKLQNSGDNLRLFGQPPFNIMLGNVYAVSNLSIDSREVDVQPRGTRKTLRLQVAPTN